MSGKELVQKTLVFLVVGQYWCCLAARAEHSSAGVVGKVWNIEVMQDAPIAVEIALGQDEVIAGENFALIVRFMNVTPQPVELRGLAPTSSLPYIWYSVKGEAFERVERIHTGDVYVPSRGRSTTILAGNDTIEYRVFLMNHIPLVLPREELLTERVFSLSIVVCPVVRVVEGEGEIPIAVESNILNVQVGTPTQQEREAFQYLVDLDRQRGEGYIPPWEQWRLLLRKYPKVPYAARVRYNLVHHMSFEAHRDKTSGTDEVLLESIDFCLERGFPFAEAVLTSNYLEFFAETERWDLFERAAKAVAEISPYDRRFYELQARAGAFGVRLATGDSKCQDRARRRKLQPVLRKCLERALERGDEHARRIAPRVLSGLEALQDWELLEPAASLALQHEEARTREKATEALKRARVNRNPD